MRKFRDISDELLYEVCKKFLSGDFTVKQIADELNGEWRDRGIDYWVTREQIYPLINEARKRGYFLLSPPLDKAVAQRIADRYQKDPASIHVVPVRRNLGDVASATAGLALELIRRLGEKKDKKNKKHRVHLGLGAGWTTMLIAEELAKRLRAAEKIRPLSLHAMTPGFEIERPRSAPASFFGFFANLGVPIDFVGLFAPAVVRTRDYANTKRWPVVADAFARAKEIELVITSLASAADPHGDLNTFMEHGDKEGFKALKKAGWIGDVQYRPYSVGGPIMTDTGIRAVTLFELSDLEKRARCEDTPVVLVSGPCAGANCNRLRVDALKPLLQEPKLKVWSHLVLDLDTAEALLR
jgi:DNA-binding transcriptional regulator LsrR (DeoR family)